MKDFMNYDFNISDIVLSCLVPAGNGKHRHVDRPCHGIALHLDGDKDYCFSDGNVVKVKENSIIYLPKGSTYYVKTNIPGDCYAINFQVDGNAYFSPFSQKVKNVSQFLNNFKLSLKYWNSKSSGFKMHCKAILYNIICDMQEEYRNTYLPKSKYTLIQPAVQYIKDKYTSELLNVSELSKMCGITPEYFRKIYREFYGASPIEHINKLKLERARELIDSGMYSIKEACELSGYSDASHFSREFKKAFGSCPSSYFENKKMQLV